jgi:hypothetical protein
MFLERSIMGAEQENLKRMAFAVGGGALGRCWYRVVMMN